MDGLRLRVWKPNRTTYKDAVAIGYTERGHTLRGASAACPCTLAVSRVYIYNKAVNDRATPYM